MKKLLAFLVLLAALAGFEARAGILLGSLSSITTAQTNTATFVTNTAYVQLPPVTVSNNGLAITNAYSGFFRWSFDGTTFYTNASPVFIPSVTNAGSVSISGQTVSVPVYVQMLAITNAANTSTIQIGITTP